MFLSRVEFRLERAGRWYSPEYVIHQAVRGLFPDAEQRPFLYTTRNIQGRSVECLVQSPSKPTSQEGVGGDPPIASVQALETRVITLPDLTGRMFDFQMTVNATSQVDGRKLDVWDARAARRDKPMPQDRAYRHYLERRLEGAADILDVKLEGRERKELAAGRHRPFIKFVAAHVIGRIRVRDSEQFKAILQHGVGRSKGFGCGMILLARPGSLLFERPAA